ncbi:MAG: UDP-N-acetylglucosamine 1-carboxyvinyltransferase [Candidatus Marinimicrobia bacterium]|jgi:UDP-N-acetylglucosamine 1-carboxyvinyltransferase|nr:UDP-N-acetylglucosamine 1-carboxyvinyltransferase [Candidatus Neomarinimicrobiota bacterium]MBT3502285.1 UDP-N-acetylglucosamine 1-carboxyvinyltransferase [Candidatus Neomarinimicrobiota bacterium]MBT3840363.1 UDP-N-acetylglucosamine 1-carboxyvinyltransferase [Candidatus Neomarinimicrobiota bacterium]MBT3998517.1 UDP-N-acetylglucosamine 1-carboxyvinyltransferase [Candidatus Neomarinimicrobiota bacterium]MBT4578979.1 UDP-N-acetylglucosamine 1-carboxyvinyltransferase [Candidatus Neomarinimicro
MDNIFIEGQNPLSGSVKISGAKNAVLPIMTAALMAEGKSVITRVPNLRDTRTMIRLMEIVGATCTFEDDKLIIDGSTVNNPEAPYDLVKTMRASFYVLGPLLARFGMVKVSLPGGCAWGPRPVDFHLKGLEKLGAKITLESGYILAEADRLKGTELSFEFPSVGATGNIAMAAATADGTTVIDNAACEPEIVQLCEYLNLMGASIHGIGTPKLIIDGVDKLHSANIEVIPDRIEAGTFLTAGALLGEITLEDVNPKHLDTVLLKLKEAGCGITTTKSSITISPADSIQAVDMTTAVYPGFPTDLQAQWVALMTLANGSSVITDTVYHDRFSHVPELNRFGANIKLENNTAFVRGIDELIGAPVMSTDIRASASLIVAGLAAKGQTVVSRVYHIDRGYEKIEEKFRSLGANIWRKNPVT